MVTFSNLPTLNACLNGLSFVLLLCGFYFIKRRMITAHKICMLSAVSVSVLFFISYVIYHSNVGSVHFTKQGWIRPVYFTILISHTTLAVAIVPSVIITVLRAFREQFAKHMRIARWTLPIWMYVSITGVIIYLMLYHL
ncbi:MAG: DUF420 domain-containing protein [Aliifodinibius sp.]|nr:DUF420 domain-containing protein [Fodinibius sp.]NIV12445.1 DUF420 domain-containing protein [Fodinibius sp.]NIY25215.1 DUF420 domain-containing protein [Fodinibius sp.]